MNQPHSSFQHMHINGSASFAANSGRGALMGLADVIPGVSGGTIALVLGIYDQLILSITRFDLELIRLLKRRQIRQAANHVNAGFLASLLIGVAAGFILMTVLIHRLLSSQPSMQLTYAVFFGLILGSIFIVYNMDDDNGYHPTLWSELRRLRPMRGMCGWMRGWGGWAAAGGRGDPCSQSASQ